MTTRWLRPEEQAAWRGFQEMRTALDSALERQLAEHGLSHADYRVLVTLSEAEGDAVRARDLACSAGWDRSRLSHQLRRMEARGLVTRRECSEDARGTMVALTATGRRAIEAAAPGHVEAVRAKFVDLMTPEELAVVGAVADRVRAACAAPPPDGACSSSC